MCVEDLLAYDSTYPQGDLVRGRAVQASSSRRWGAIGALDAGAARAPEAISDCLAHLLAVCAFVDAVGKPSV
jgi:hypothetical protein